MLCGCHLGPDGSTGCRTEAPRVKVCIVALVVLVESNNWPTKLPDRHEIRPTLNVAVPEQPVEPAEDLDRTNSAKRGLWSMKSDNSRVAVLLAQSMTVVTRRTIAPVVIHELGIHPEEGSKGKEQVGQTVARNLCWGPCLHSLSQPGMCGCSSWRHAPYLL